MYSIYYFLGERKNRFISPFSSFVSPASYAVILFVPACSVWACGVGGLPRRRYSLHVRAVVRPSRPPLFVQWGPQIILIFGESVAQGVVLYKGCARSRTSLSASAPPRPLGLNAGVAHAECLHRFTMWVSIWLLRGVLCARFP